MIKYLKTKFKTGLEKETKVFLSIGLSWEFVLLVICIIVCCPIYQQTVTWTFNRTAITSENLNIDTNIIQLPSLYNGVKNIKERVFYLARNQEWNDEISPEMRYKEFVDKNGDNCLQYILTGMNTDATAIRLVLEIAKAMGNNSSNESTPGKVDNNSIRQLALRIVDAPRCMREQKTNNIDNDSGFTSWMGFVKKFTVPEILDTSNSGSGDIVIDYLYQICYVSSKFANNKIMNDEVESEKYKIAHHFIVETINKIKSHPEVLKMKKWNEIMFGGLQYIMFILVVWALVLIFIRWLVSYLQELQISALYTNYRYWSQTENKDLKSTFSGYLDLIETNSNSGLYAKIQILLSRPPIQFSKNSLAYFMLTSIRDFINKKKKTAFIDSMYTICDTQRDRESETRMTVQWIARTIPAVGFIGTVIGISNALASAQRIVQAANATDQVAAVQFVTSTLGVAFTTTFIALICGLILSAFDTLQSYYENRLFFKLKDFINEIEREL